MTSKFDGKYLRNGKRYSKSVKYLIYHNFSHVQRKKTGELWSTNYGDLDVESYPPKWTFSEDHILAPKGCCAPRFLYVLENDQVLLVHHPLGMGTHLQFFSKGSKIVLKFSKCVPIALAVVGVAPRNFAT